ncbi:hypothetical protein BK126_19960 [Paenibacillus sp. FSL H7-0326]|uniref:PepSY domain-containing protein n=1 Tax=Paenibacillus sp. FSL H7-0326 TaxID=1921144 RepID=UPI00096E5804|nr:PepSY domain-containing protein [Paenibacillus sp. FSL H7-0326]OMC66299.1 hypothetical protein BK126_19960 [Paenibacillus sp. FSL H7-0326]
MNVKKWGLYGGVAAILVLAIGLYYFQPWNKSDILSAEAVSESVTQQYPGTIEENKLQGDEYHLRLVTKTGDEYRLTVDAESGSIQTIEQISEGEVDTPVPQSREAIKKAVLADTPGKLLLLELVSDSPEGKYYKAEVQTKDQIVELRLDPYSGEVLSRSETKPQNPDSDNKQPAETQEPIRLISEQDAIDIALAEVKGEFEDIELRARESDIPYYLVEIENVSGEEMIVQVLAITGTVKSVEHEDDFDDNDDDQDDENQ